MMRLVDTSAWIEWLIGSPTGEAVTTHLPSNPTGWCQPGCSSNWQKMAHPRGG
jgi:hypothetical protein